MPEQRPSLNKPFLPVAILLGTVVVVIGVLIGLQRTNGFQGGIVTRSTPDAKTTSAPRQNTATGSEARAPSTGAVSSPASPVEKNHTPPADSASVTAYLTWLQQFNRERLDYEAGAVQEVQERTTTAPTRLRPGQSPGDTAKTVNILAIQAMQLETRQNARIQKQYQGMARVFNQTPPPASCAQLHAAYLGYMNFIIQSLGEITDTNLRSAKDITKAQAIMEELKQKQQKQQAELPIYENQFKQDLEALRVEYNQVKADLFDIPLSLPQ